MMSVDGWTIAGELGSAAGGAVLLVGAAVGARYGRKANPSIEAECHRTPVGLVLTARPSITGAGPVPIRFPQSTRRGTRVEVAEVTKEPTGRLRDGRVYVGRPTLFPEGTTITGGETVTQTEIFSLPGFELLARWRVDFFVIIPKTFRRRGYWVWATSTFVPVPPKLAE